MDILTSVVSAIITMLAVPGLAAAQDASGGSSGGGDPELGVLCLILQCLIPLIIYLIWGMVAIWARNDAASRGIDSPWLWGVVVFFGGIVGLIIYLLVPRAQAKERNVADHWRMELRPPPGTCPHCGSYAGTNVGRCPSCGGDLGG